jgi:uncharacterized protein YdeI (YjbR/CyaY-like superfamily)
MPEFVKRALVERGVEAAYEDRPPYQRNDYIMWITTAKQEATRDKRLRRMLGELEIGGSYMNMPYRARASGQVRR